MEKLKTHVILRGGKAKSPVARRMRIFTALAAAAALFLATFAPFFAVEARAEEIPVTFTFTGIGQPISSQVINVSSGDNVTISISNNTNDIAKFMYTEASEENPAGSTTVNVSVSVNAEDVPIYRKENIAQSMAVYIAYIEQVDETHTNVVPKFQVAFLISDDSPATPSSSNSSSSSSSSGSAASEKPDPYDEARRAYAEFHDHARHGNTDAFTWETVREASEYSDGEEVYRCPECGYVLYRVPVSAYSVFNKTAAEKIQRASAGGEVTVDARQWISFHKMVLDALKARPDVTLTVNYSYEKTPYTLTIPAGTSLSGISEEEPFAGFLYLAQQTGQIPSVR